MGGFSIHAPREGSGTLEERPSKSDNYFSIHAPREGSGSGASWAIACPSASFLSTLPGRGAAYSNRRTGRPRRIFYPRSPGGERQVFDLHSVDISLFSIHAPREGSGSDDKSVCVVVVFSIHAPREGSGAARAICSRGQVFFYPRSPGGEPAPGGLSRRSPFFFPTPPPGAGPRDAAVHQCTGGVVFYPRSPGGERLGRRGVVGGVI